MLNFVRSSLFPLLAKVWGAEDADTAYHSPVQHLTGDHGCLYGLAHPNVVRYEQSNRVEAERHDQWNELIGSRNHGQPSHRTERSGAAPQTEAHGISKQERSGEVSGQLRVGSLVLRWLEGFRFQRHIDAHSVSVGAVNRPEPHDVRLFRR
jgi:hypothetical protein